MALDRVILELLYIFDNDLNYILIITIHSFKRSLYVKNQFLFLYAGSFYGIRTQLKVENK